jgi:tetratricopeptide (TPR) repeat protein
MARLFARTVTLLALALALASVAWPPTAVADEATKARAERLDLLFKDLQAETVEARADFIVLEIWHLWGQSGRPDVDRLLEEATDHMRTGNHERALAILDRIVEMAPDFAEGWNKRATVLYMLDRHDRSLEDIARVLKLEPRHFGAIAGSGLIAIARSDWKSALVAYRRALALNPFLKERLELIPALEQKVKGDPI